MALSAQDEKLVRRLFDDYLAAWNDARDPKACADLYERDGDLLAADGEFLSSPEDIERYYVDRLGGTYEDFRAGDIEVFSLREIGPNVAILDARWNVFRIDSSGQRAETVAPVMGAIVCSKSDDQWMVSAARIMVPQVPRG